jgi:uncharacterized NAD(P)/FAD-binding protein YdhS
MTKPSRNVVIVGAGFSGTAVAINLLRFSHPRPLKILLVDSRSAGRGIAYARRSYPYLLNVPAGRMSANSSDPLEFLRFAQRTLPDVTEDDFLPRSLYGDYLESTLRAAELDAPAGVQLVQLKGTACSVQRFPPRRLSCPNGRRP